MRSVCHNQVISILFICKTGRTSEKPWLNVTAFATRKGKPQGDKTFSFLHFIHLLKSFHILVCFILSYLELYIVSWIFYLPFSVFLFVVFVVVFLLLLFFWSQELYAVFKSVKSISNCFLNALILTKGDPSLSLLDGCHSGYFLSTPFFDLF